MFLRRFREGDEAALQRVFHSAIHVGAVRDYAPEQLNAWAPAQMDAAKWLPFMRELNPWIVEDGGEILAYADIQPTGYIDHFYVAGAHQRRGIGSTLMRALVAEAKTSRMVEIFSHVSKTAQPLFARFGFEVIEKRAPVIRGVTLENALMRKHL